MFKSVTKKAVIATAVLTMVVGASSALATSWKGNLVIDGSSTVYPLTAAVAEEFSIDNPNVKITVSESGTGTGMARFCNGEITIANASRLISDKEKTACQAKNITPYQFRVAYDGITVIVNQKNTWAKQLTMDQLKKMFQKDSTIKRWSDINPKWPAKAIKFYTPGSASGTFEFFTEHVNGTKKVQRVTQVVQSEDDNILVKGVAGSQYAIGYLGYGYYNENKATLNAVAVSSDAKTFVTATKSTIQNFKYPISRTLYVYVNKSKIQANKLENAFMKFYLKNAYDFSPEVGMIPLAKNLYTTESKKTK